MHALKLVVSNQSPPAPPQRRNGAPSDSAANKKEAPTILVVEDEVLIRLAVADYLRDCGYRVLEAGNASEAVAIFQAAEPVQVLFSDVNMPGEMNGFALASWVRAHYPGVQVILTSGLTGAAKTAEALCHAGPLLAKPYSHEALASHIRRLLER